MTRWQRTLDLLPEWDEALDGKVTLPQLSGVIATRLKLLRPFGHDGKYCGLDDTRETLADKFKRISEKGTTNVEEFETVMSELYDWADTRISGSALNAKRACRVRTF